MTAGQGTAGTVPAGIAGTSGPRRDPTRIGQARPSHLVTTSGVGATIDLPSMSVLVRGLDAWSPEHQDTIEEPRLLAAVRWVLGQQVRALRHAPWDPQAKDDGWTRVGVPVTPFPRWLRCPRCHRLGPIDPPGQFAACSPLRPTARPGEVSSTHGARRQSSQTRLANRRACVPARFIVVCEDGHMDDFPYVEYVHMTRSEGVCDGPDLTMFRRRVHPGAAGDGQVRHL